MRRERRVFLHKRALIRIHQREAILNGNGPVFSRTPYPGTKVYETVKREGRLLMNDWEDYVFFEQKARYEMDGMSAELVTEMYRKAYRQFYLRPGPIMRRLQSKDFWFNIGRNVRIARRTFFKKPEKSELKRVIEAEGLSI